jgi:hypothetical protein
MRVPELMCDPGSLNNVSGTSYSQQLKIKPSWILFWFHNRYNTALFLQWIRFHQVCWCFPLYVNMIADDKIIIAFVIIDPHWIIFIEVKSDHITEKVLPSLCIRTLHKPYRRRSSCQAGKYNFLLFCCLALIKSAISSNNNRGFCRVFK